MNKLVVLLFGIFLFASAVAQEKPDPIVFKKPVEVVPNPPNAVKGWTYQENWKTDDGLVSVLVGEYPGQIIKFPFAGNAVGIAVYTGNDTGMIEFSVDEADWQTLDLFAVTPQLKYFTLESELKGKKHMLQVRMSADKNPNSKGQKCILRYFVVNEK